MKRVTVYGSVIGLFLGACAFATSAKYFSKDTDVVVSPEIKKAIVSEIGNRGLKELVANGCIESVVDKLNGQGWSDDWCADRYKHVF